jgi:hypothetical protein
MRQIIAVEESAVTRIRMRCWQARVSGLPGLRSSIRRLKGAICLPHLPKITKVNFAVIPCSKMSSCQCKRLTPFSEGFGRRFHLKTVLDSGFSLYFSLFAVESGSLVTGSTAILSWSGPGTYVTDRTGHIGYTFGPNGFARGCKVFSSRST